MLRVRCKLDYSMDCVNPGHYIEGIRAFFQKQALDFQANSAAAPHTPRCKRGPPRPPKLSLCVPCDIPAGCVTSAESSCELSHPRCTLRYTLRHHHGAPEECGRAQHQLPEAHRADHAGAEEQDEGGGRGLPVLCGQHIWSVPARPANYDNIVTCNVERKISADLVSTFLVHIAHAPEYRFHTGNKWA